MQRRLHTIGWALFLSCSVLFVVSGIRSRDPWSITPSALFRPGRFALSSATVPTKQEVGEFHQISSLRYPRQMVLKIKNSMLCPSIPTPHSYVRNPLSQCLSGGFRSSIGSTQLACFDRKPFVSVGVPLNPNPLLRLELALCASDLVFWP